MKKLLITADNHLASKYPYSTSANPYSDLFFNQAYLSIKQVIKYACDNKIDILNAGDFINNDVVGSPEILAALSLFDVIKNNNIKMYLNSGNHELGYEEKIPTSVESLSFKNKSIITSAFKHKWTVHKWHDMNIYMMPYRKDGVFSKYFEELMESDIKYPACLCIHQNIKGIKINNAIIKNGLAEQEIFRIACKKFKFIICGHIHNQYISSKSGIPFIIPGSTMSSDFKDDGSEKIFIELSLDDDYNIKKIKRIPIANQIKFVSIDFKDIDINFINNCNRRVIKIFLHIEEEEKFNELKSKLIDNGAISVIPNWIRKVDQVDLVGYERPVNVSMDEWLIKYMEKKGYDYEEREAANCLNKEIFGE